MDSVTRHEPDLLVGAKAIAAHLGLTERQAHHLLFTKRLPALKLGGRVAARKSTLAAWLADAERRAA